MPSLLADNDCSGCVEWLLNAWRADGLLEIWEALAWPISTFADLGLKPRDSDATVWLCCQENDVVLLTNNRNRDGVDSLESVLRRFNDSEKLPVVTISDVQRFGSDRNYALRASRKALEYFFLIDDLRGTGRLYIP